MSSTIKDLVIFEDDQLLVINKPTGIVVNLSDTSPEGTLQNYLQDYLKIDASLDDEFSQRAGIVHRLDKDTSGVMIVSKTEESFYALKDQFKTRTVNKEYIAVVLGTVKDKMITIKAPLGRDQGNRTKMAVVKGGRFALTNIELLETKTYEEFEISVVLAKPLTGRTHQIRVHLSAINHPVASDRIYLGNKRYEDTYAVFGRLMLHAWKLGFNHPKTDNEMFFEAPLPDTFDKIYSKHE